MGICGFVAVMVYMQKDLEAFLPAAGYMVYL
jgi:hypothetical protein